MNSGCIGCLLLRALPQVAFLCSFTTASFPDSLALVKGQQLSLGTIDGETAAPCAYC
jgi:hypothetical protein